MKGDAILLRHRREVHCFCRRIDYWRAGDSNQGPDAGAPSKIAISWSDSIRGIDETALPQNLSWVLRIQGVYAVVLRRHENNVVRAPPMARFLT